MQLRALQHWVQDALERPYGRPALRARGRPAVAAVVTPSATLTARERLDIYVRQGVLRFVEVLRADYPTVAHVLGAPGFRRLGCRYLGAHPSRSFTLNPLGRALPAFLAGPVRVPRRALLRDVAALEWAIAEAYIAPDGPGPLPPEAFTRIPAGRWPQVRVRLQPEARLLALRHPVGDLIQSVRREQAHTLPGRGDAWYLVHRRGGQGFHVTLSRAKHDCLRALARGLPIARALRAAAAAWRGASEGLPAELFGWFREWATDGLFTGLATSPRRHR